MQIHTVFSQSIAVNTAGALRKVTMKNASSHCFFTADRREYRWRAVKVGYENRCEGDTFTLAFTVGRCERRCEVT